MGRTHHITFAEDKNITMAQAITYRKIGNEDKYLDSATKYLYANTKGVKVFALYGMGDGTDVTILYAVGGANAERFNNDITDIMEGHEGGTFKNIADIDRWIAGVRGWYGKPSNYLPYTKNGRTKIADDRLSDRKPRSNGTGDFGESTGDQRGDDFVRYSKLASMTTERIDREIEDSGAGSRTDYARSWITSISPTDFLRLMIEVFRRGEEI